MTNIITNVTCHNHITVRQEPGRKKIHNAIACTVKQIAINLNLAIYYYFKLIRGNLHIQALKAAKLIQ